MEQTLPPELDSISNEEEIEKKHKEDEKLEIQVEPGLDLKMDKLRDQYGN